MLMMCINTCLALYFERNSHLNFAKIELCNAKPVLRSPFLPTSLVHLSRKVSELETMANDNCWRIKDKTRRYQLLEVSRAGNPDSRYSGRKSSDFQIYRNVAEMPLNVRLSGKVGAYLISRNSQPVVKKSPANVKSMGI